MSTDDSWAFGRGGFWKLYGDRLAQSSLLDLHPVTRWVFIFIGSQADYQGRYRCATIAGLARAAAVSEEDAKRAVDELTSPDPDSTTPDNDGRRIRRIRGGFEVLNYEKYRDFRAQPLSGAERARRHRAKKSGVTERNGALHPVTERNEEVTPSNDHAPRHQTPDTRHQKEDLSNQQQSLYDSSYSPKPKKAEEITRAYLAVINALWGRRLTTLSPDVVKKVKARLKDWTPSEIVAAPVVIWLTHPEVQHQKHSPEVFLRDGENPKTRNGQTYGGYYWMSRAYEKAYGAEVTEEVQYIIERLDRDYGLNVCAMLKKKGVALWRENESGSR